MQHRYVGDIADFGKHGLLRFLSGATDPQAPAPDLRLGLIWYFHHDEIHVGSRQKVNGDGGHTGYLRRTARDDKEVYRQCDPGLWESLRGLVYRNARCVHCAEGAGLLPEDTCFYSDPLIFTPRMPAPLKRELRAHWWRHALRATEGADLVCCDPDNGIGRDAHMYREKGTKYVYYSDLRALWDRDQSLVVYHHLGRSDNEAQALEVAGELRKGLEGEPAVMPLIFSRGSSRVFLVAPHPRHADLVGERVGRFLDGPWAQHFRRAGERPVRPRPAPSLLRAGASLLAEERD